MLVYQKVFPVSQVVDFPLGEGKRKKHRIFSNPMFFLNKIKITPPKKEHAKPRF
jgi:hypothetical protein